LDRNQANANANPDSFCHTSSNANLHLLADGNSNAYSDYNLNRNPRLDCANLNTDAHFIIWCRFDADTHTHDYADGNIRAIILSKLYFLLGL
jgi:hypothetical protein